MSKLKSRKIVENLHYRDWVRRRAEQLALREQPAVFLDLYAKRTAAMGFSGYDEAIVKFDDFLSPYEGHAHRAWAAENEAARHLVIQNELKNMLKPTTPYAGEGTVELDEAETDRGQGQGGLT